MTWIGKAIEGLVTIGKFIIGDKPKPDQQLSEPLGELEVEKAKRRAEDARRERKRHGSR